ncbi:hypothetical protein B0H14DRAFT_1486636 [Mycena olivaceomarginata]|nr:hypothetical protein B0H14DRAFT_1486636 [Mycena olivaceomarginata]
MAWHCFPEAGAIASWPASRAERRSMGMARSLSPSSRLRVNCNFPIATSNTIKCLSEWEGVAMGGETQANLALSDSRVMRRNSLSCLITSDRVQVNHRRFEMRGWASHRVRDAGAEAHIYIDAHGPQSMVHGGVGNVRPDSRWRLTVLDLHYGLPPDSTAPAAVHRLEPRPDLPVAFYERRINIFAPVPVVSGFGFGRNNFLPSLCDFRNGARKKWGVWEWS